MFQPFCSGLVSCSRRVANSKSKSASKCRGGKPSESYGDGSAQSVHSRAMLKVPRSNSRSRKVSIPAIQRAFKTWKRWPRSGWNGWRISAHPIINAICEPVQFALAVPTVRDRVVQMATLLILEPIFEADFEDCSYGFRPGRSAHQALEEIRGHLKAGYQAVYDADLKGYFDSIPHDKLLACVRMRVVDRSVLKLIRMWLETPVVEPESEGKPGK